MSFAQTARPLLWVCGAGMFALAACAGSQLGAETPADVSLDWPELGGGQLPAVGGGEADAVAIIAIEQYPNLVPVAGALHSADDWYGYFTRVLRVPAPRVHLAKGQLTAVDMRAAVERARAQVRGRGRLWVVFIGHGAPVAGGPGSQLKASDGLLLDSAAVPNALTGLKHSELMKLVKPAARSRRGPIVILDASYSGKVAAPSGDGAASLTGTPVQDYAFEPLAPPEVITFTAATSGQAAYPLPGAAVQRRAFSYLLIGGLSGWADTAGDADGAVSPEEAIGFTRVALQRLGRDQTPQLTGRVSVPLVRAGEVPPLDLGRLTASTSRDSEPPRVH